MSVRSEPFVGAARPVRRAATLGVWLDRQSVFSWLIMAPPLLFLAALVGYPFCYGILLSLQDRPVAHAGTFVGLKNFATNLHDPLFWRVGLNTFVYTLVATLLKMVGGLGLAVAMNQHFRMKNLVRALLLLPFIVPTVLSTVAWMWMLDPAFSVVNRLLIGLGVPRPGPSWLGNPILAMVSIIVINTWRGLPFYGITLLAGLQTVPPELYEAATIDGASGWQRFRYVTLPLLQPIILIVTLFSVIFTFADFQLVYVLTHGGPQNATQLLATYAFDIAMSAGQPGLGVPRPGPSWLGNPILAMVSIIVINTWRGLPFYGITLLAGLQTVPPELYEAATIDGASGWQRFRYVTLPLLQPIILIVTLFSVIFTFADFQLVYVLTHGGPQNATQLFATYAFDIAMGAGQLGLGASVALAMLPALALLIVALTIYLRRE